MRSARPWRRAVVALVVAGCGTGGDDPGADFATRVASYTAVVRRAAAGLPPGEPGVEADDARRAALAAEVRAALPDWGPGRIFTPAIAVALRELIAGVVEGPGGRDVRGAILDENPMRVRPAALATYPEAAPLATMPPGMLAVLPELPDDLEYRFVGHDLILRDVRANLVVDVLEDAFR